MQTTSNIQSDLILEAIDNTQILNLPAIESLSMSIKDLGIDSLNLISLAMSLEDQVSLKIDIDKLSPSSTLAELISQLKPLTN